MSSFLYSCASASSALLDEFKYLCCTEGAFDVASCRVAQKTQMSRVEETCPVSESWLQVIRDVTYSKSLCAAHDGEYAVQ